MVSGIVGSYDPKYIKINGFRSHGAASLRGKVRVGGDQPIMEGNRIGLRMEVLKCVYTAAAIVAVHRPEMRLDGFALFHVAGAVTAFFCHAGMDSRASKASISRSASVAGRLRRCARCTQGACGTYPHFLNFVLNGSFRKGCYGFCR